MLVCFNFLRTLLRLRGDDNREVSVLSITTFSAPSEALQASTSGGGIDLFAWVDFTIVLLHRRGVSFLSLKILKLLLIVSQ